MTTEELRRLPHLTASEVGECLRVKTASGWRLTDGVRYCTRLFCALTAELPEYKITDGKETYPTAESETADTATASDTNEADKAAGESSPAADAAESETQGEVVANCNRLPDAAAETDTAAQEDDRVTTAGETAAETAETSKGWAARAWTAAREWCAKAWADACEWCAEVWRKITNKG